MKHACEKMTQLSSAKLERRLSLAERLRLMLHLWVCAACRHYDASITRLHQALRLRQQHIMENTRLPQEKREKIEAILQQLSQK